MPFKSKAQARFMFSQHPEIAQEFADKTKSIKKLPEHVNNKKSGAHKMKEHEKKERHKKEHKKEAHEHEAKKHMHKHHMEMKKFHEKEMKHHMKHAEKCAKKK